MICRVSYGGREAGRDAVEREKKQKERRPGSCASHGCWDGAADGSRRKQAEKSFALRDREKRSRGWRRRRRRRRRRRNNTHSRLNYFHFLFLFLFFKIYFLIYFAVRLPFTQSLSPASQLRRMTARHVSAMTFPHTFSGTFGLFLKKICCYSI